MAIAHVNYHYEPGGWWAESPEYPGYSAWGANLAEVRLLAHEGLKFYAEDADLVVIDPIVTTAQFTTTTVIEVEEPAVPSILGLIPLSRFNAGLSRSERVETLTGV